MDERPDFIQSPPSLAPSSPPPHPHTSLSSLGDLIHIGVTTLTPQHATHYGFSAFQLAHPFLAVVLAALSGRAPDSISGLWPLFLGPRKVLSIITEGLP